MSYEGTLQNRRKSGKAQRLQKANIRRRMVFYGCAVGLRNYNRPAVNHHWRMAFIEINGTMKMKIAATIAALAIATPALAETFVLETNEYWQTSLWVDDVSGSKYCVLENDNANMGFRFMVGKSGKYATYISDSSVKNMQGDGTLDVVLKMEGESPASWTLSNAFWSGGYAFLVSFYWNNEDERREFFRDFVINDSIDLMNKGVPVAGWSLQGAAAGVSSLDTCRSIISGDPL